MTMLLIFLGPSEVANFLAKKSAAGQDIGEARCLHKSLWLECCFFVYDAYVRTKDHQFVNQSFTISSENRDRLVKNGSVCIFLRQFSCRSVFYD